MMTFKTIGDIRKANDELGHHFFEEGAMRFFDSRIETGVLRGNYFVTSEQFHGSTGDGPRMFTIRKAGPNGKVDTIGSHQKYTTKEDAEAAIGRLLF